MSGGNDSELRPTRRGLVRAAAGLTVAAGTGLGTGGVAEALVEARDSNQFADDDRSQTEPFWGTHRAGSRHRCKVTLTRPHSTSSRPSARM